MRIAEQEVRWADAAAHVDRAARLAKTFDHLSAARAYAWPSGQYPTAQRFGEDLVALAETAPVISDADRATACNEHALTLRAVGAYAAAEPLFRQAIEIGEASLGIDHPDYAVWLNNLAGLLRATDRPEQAAPLYRQAVEIFETSLDPEHRNTRRAQANLDAVLADGG